MALLPERRVKELAPFEESGVDLMGHFFVKMNGRANHKVWIAVFTCLVTRSVHTELLYNLDADSMINAIVRFAARRPGVRRFTSDQGTNLVGANNVLEGDADLERLVGSTAAAERFGVGVHSSVDASLWRLLGACRWTF